MRLRWIVAPLVIACSSGPTDPPVRNLTEFTERIDGIRRELGIPGMAGVVMLGDSVVWEGLLGYADVAAQRPVSRTTHFHLASLTKTFASTIVMQLVEQGLVSLDATVNTYGVAMPNASAVRVRHLLSHTSEGEPGTAFRYSGDRYALLDQVILSATGESFAKRVVDRIITPLALEHTAPNPANVDAFGFSPLDRPSYLSALATGYGRSAGGTPPVAAYPSHFSSAAGLVSTALEVARYSVALDGGQFISPATRAIAYTRAVGTGGRNLPHALGWFVSDIEGQQLVWHYGYWIGNSSLIIKVPARRLTFVVLTNSDQLSAPFNLGAGDLTSSPVARAFVTGFVTGSVLSPQ
jgi:CubicO group peptidase (beta-lactamase class C family)